MDSEAFRSNANQWIDFDGYERLEGREVRLLEMNNEGDTGLINCRLHRHDLDSAPEYYALSYYWGAPPLRQDLEAIKLNGVMVYLRPTLHRFLKRLIPRLEGRLVWLDYLCINQRDTSHRNEQVTMMGDIFANALAVYAWLDEGTSDTDFAIDAIDALRSGQEGSLFKDWKVIIHRGLDQICRRSWWSRTWVIQEAVRAKTVHLLCGGKSVVWNDFFLALARYTRETLETRNSDWSIVESAEMSARYHAEKLNDFRENFELGKASLIEVIQPFQDCQSTDPRDKLFSFLSLAADGHLLAVDYTLSLLEIVMRFLSTQCSASPIYARSLLEQATRLIRCLDISPSDLDAGLIASPSDQIVATFSCACGFDTRWSTEVQTASFVLCVDEQPRLDSRCIDTYDAWNNLDANSVDHGPRSEVHEIESGDRLRVMSIVKRSDKNDYVAIANWFLPKHVEVCKLNKFPIQFRTAGSAGIQQWDTHPLRLHLSRTLLYELVESQLRESRHLRGYETAASTAEVVGRLCNCAEDGGEGKQPDLKAKEITRRVSLQARPVENWLVNSRIGKGPPPQGRHASGFQLFRSHTSIY